MAAMETQCKFSNQIEFIPFMDLHGYMDFMINNLLHELDWFRVDRVGGFY